MANTPMLTIEPLLQPVVVTPVDGNRWIADWRYVVRAGGIKGSGLARSYEDACRRGGAMLERQRA